MKIENGSVVTVGSASGGNTATATITNGAGGQQQIIIHQAHPQQQQQVQSNGQTTITSANGQIIKENADGTIQIQQQASPTQTLNAQVCLDSMALSDVDVRTNTNFLLINFDVVTLSFGLNLFCLSGY